MTISEATGTLPTLPGRYYYDPATHAVEREQIFRARVVVRGVCGTTGRRAIT
ncbi:MAG: hypothetical protein U0232_05745 [Thermomicrobiales bacterium]